MTITAEQIKFRKGKIGASQFGQAIGHGYGSRTRAELFHQMKGHMPPIVETTAMRVGNFMEPFILEEYTLKTGRAAEEYPDTQVHPDEPRIICHCDGITSDKTRLIEIKNVGPRMASAWEHGVPEYYWVQGCGQSMLTGIKKVDFAAYFGGNDVRVFEVEYTDEDHAALYDGLKDFLCYLDNDEEPPHVVADLPNLDKYYESSEESIVADDLTMANAMDFARYKNGKKIDPLEKEVMDGVEFQIKEYMGDKSTLVSEDGEVIWTWKQGKDKTVTDWEGVAAKLAEQYNVDSLEYDGIVNGETTTKKGNRTFLCKIKENV
jgi:predicted phage-related endonuclease